MCAREMHRRKWSHFTVSSRWRVGESGGTLTATNPPAGNRPMYRPLAVLVAVAGSAGAADPEVRVGSKVDDLRFKDIRYLSRSLADLGDKKAYVFAFVQSGCPLAEKYLPVLDRLDRE